MKSLSCIVFFTSDWDIKDVEAETERNDWETDDLEENPFACDLCERSVAKAVALSFHMTQLGESFSCDVCEMCYTPPIALENHKRKHTGEKTFLWCVRKMFP